MDPTTSSNTSAREKPGASESTEGLQLESQLLENIGDRQTIIKWIIDNYQKFESIDEFFDAPELEPLTHKEAKKIKNVVQSYFTTNSKVVKTFSTEKLINQSIIPDEEKMRAKILPLITCCDVVEGDSIMEKFHVRADYVERFCEINGRCDIFYKDVSGGIHINFDELNKFSVELWGVFGKLYRALEFFQQLLTETSFNDLQQSLEKEGSGMYLIIAANLGETSKHNSYLYFFSKDDEDYQSMDPKSRSIHFIRYITQLAGNMLLLFDDTDEKLLSHKPNVEEESKKRTAIFTVNELRLQKEEVFSTPLGSLKLSKHKNDTLKLFGTSNGLLAIKTWGKDTEQKTKTKETLLEAKSFHSHFQLTDIQKDAKISTFFIKDYLKQYHQETLKNIVRDLDEEKTLLQNSAEDSDFFKMMDFSALLFFIRKCYPASFEIMRAYFEATENEASRHQFLWRNSLEMMNSLDSNLNSSVSFNLEPILLQELDVYSEILHRLCLGELLSLSKTEESSTPFHELFTCAWKSNCFGSTKTLLIVNKQEPGIHDEKVQSAYRDLVKSMTSPDNLSQNSDKLSQNFCEQLELKITEVVDKLSSITAVKESLARCPEYVRLRQRLYFKHVERLIEDLRKQALTTSFFEKIDCKKSEASAEVAKTKSQQARPKVIVSIEKTKNLHRPVAVFKITYYEIEVTEPKVVLNVSKLSLKGNASDVRHANGEILPNVDMMKFMEIYQTELTHMEILRVFLMNEGNILIAGNTENTSSFMAINIHKNEIIQEAFFRRRLSNCDYNSDSRLLCVFSEAEDFSELITFQLSTDFKTKETYSRFDVLKQHQIHSIRDLCLQPNSEYVWLLDGNGQRLLKLNIKNGASVSSDEISCSLSEVSNVRRMQMSRRGDCLFLSLSEAKMVPFMTHTSNVLGELALDFDNGESFGMLQLNQSFLAIRSPGDSIVFQAIVVFGSEHQMRLKEDSDIQDANKVVNQMADKKGIRLKHWINNLFCVFAKFPCENYSSTKQQRISIVALSQNVSCNFERVLEHSLIEIDDELKSTRKPVVVFTPRALVLSQTNGSLLKFGKHEELDFCVNLGSFLRKLIAFTPSQIARCQNSNFLVLQNGKVLPTNNVKDVFEMQSLISLGLLETLFKSWTGPVIVISSMGKQTSGKSFMLNHLLGASFNISGARCTDGCWVSVNLQDDCLYVMMDFEGLGSIERTDQDDMLLSLFNAALSLVTLYKTEKRIDRATDSLFQKFNLAKDHLKGDDNLFRGCFAIIINDIAETDVDDVKDEFVSKINSILCREKSNNFISKMYGKGFQIRAFPPFQTCSFYEDMKKLRVDVINTDPVFIGGLKFLDTLKLVLAKLTLNDFTPLTRQHVDARIRFLRNHLKSAFIYGQLGENSDKQAGLALSILDDKNRPLDSKWQSDLEANTGFLDDVDFVWSMDNGDFDDIVYKFSNLSIQSWDNHVTWRESLENFICECANKRIERVEFWVSENLEMWTSKSNPDYDDAISAFMDVFNLEKGSFQLRTKLCNEKCSRCYLKCTLNSAHVSDHLCNTSHICAGNCDYCLEEKTQCQEAAGHQGLHLCREIDHVCGEICMFETENGCKGQCQEAPNHSCDHKCGLTIHTCNVNCSRPDCYGKCNIDCIIPHSVHKCEKNQCLHKCCVENCRNPCVKQDHFHGYEILSKKYAKENNEEVNAASTNDAIQSLDDSHFPDIEKHFCGNEHTCNKMCSHNGHCILSTERTGEFVDKFCGKLSTFEYNKKLTNVGKKLPCLVKIPPYQQFHTGNHWCSNETGKVHICRTTCRDCENICTKPYNHEIESDDILHRTAHGNMINCHWLSTSSTFEFDNHEMEAGESAETVYCHVSCSKKGRGHTHIVKCPGECDKKYSEQNDHRRHDTRKWLPDNGSQFDEIWHREYWKLQGFEDPCSVSESKSFEKCNWYCANPDHDKDNKSYCVLDLWHKPVTNLAEAGLQNGYVSSNGHVNSCKH